MHNRTEKRSATIMAFSHFVVENSACHYMFADIQGESEHWPFLCRLVDEFAGSMDRNSLVPKESILTLFDPMTHTPQG